VGDLARIVAHREAQLRETLTRTEEQFRRLGLLPADADVSVVLFVGTGHSDAWVEVFRQAPTLFVALEMFGDPPSVELLATHECLHVAHYRSLSRLLSSRPHLTDHVGFRIWAEGLAVAGTRLLRPGHDDAAYLLGVALLK
jgi:hypothetical protein